MARLGAGAFGGFPGQYGQGAGAGNLSLTGQFGVTPGSGLMGSMMGGYRQGPVGSSQLPPAMRHRSTGRGGAGGMLSALSGRGGSGVGGVMGKYAGGVMGDYADFARAQTVEGRLSGLTGTADVDPAYRAWLKKMEGKKTGSGKYGGVTGLLARVMASGVVKSQPDLAEGSFYKQRYGVGWDPNTKMTLTAGAPPAGGGTGWSKVGNYGTQTY